MTECLVIYNLTELTLNVLEAFQALEGLFL